MENVVDLIFETALNTQLALMLEGKFFIIIVLLIKSFCQVYRGRKLILCGVSLLASIMSV